nr:reverse transcriptase domain-containing protein [Tanacetum cinerariifolium]
MRGLRFESLRKNFPSRDYLRIKKCLSNLSTPGGQGFSKTDLPELETKAEIAFRQMKKSIADLPMLTALKEKEELIIYLTAAKEAINAVLMTERDRKQMPVCFVSRALQGEHDIHYRSKTSVNGQILADFIVECSEDDSLDIPMEDKEELPDPWVLFTNGSSCTDGSGAGLILTNPEGMEFTYALSFAHLSKHVLVEELKEKSIDEKEVLAVLEEEGRTWMTSVYKYLAEGILSDEKKKARVVNYILREIHEGSCSMHAGPRSMMAKALRSGYYWPTMHMNARMMRECNDCQCFASIKHSQTKSLVERVNRSLGEGIKAWLDERRKHWMEEISHVLWAHRIMIKSSNRETPFSLTYGTEAVISVEIGMPTWRTAKVDMIKNDEALGINLDLLEEKRKQAAIQEAKSKAKIEKYYHAWVRNTSFKPGDLV